MAMRIKTHQTQSAEEVVAEILEQLALKSKTEYILNILIFADFTRWKTEDLGEIIGFLTETAEQQPEQNRIVLSYNPILTICLACQHLQAIGGAIGQYKHECEDLKESLLDLGANIVDSLEDPDIAMSIFMDTDFQDRTVFHLITLHERI